MHNVYTIGTISTSDEITTVSVNSQYRKALKYVDKFSHVHLLYISDSKDNSNLQTVVSKVLSLDINSGVITVSCPNVIVGGELIDIKPYFPCEDSVKTSFTLDSLADRYINTSQNSSGEYELGELGTIYNRSGEIYISVSDMPDIISPYVKVIWWFSKFDSAMYRRTTECKPPYENAPKSGIFATRSPVRPNPIAMTVAKVTRLDHINKRIYVNLEECFDNTPCLGIWNYGVNADYVADAIVPEWLEHWPLFKEEQPEDNCINIFNNTDLSELISEGKQVCEKDIEDMSVKDKEEILPDSIFVKGARENNLKGVNVKIPYGKVTAVVGVSGSGKSSLVNNTIYAECKRRMGYLNSERNLLQKPDMEYMTGAIPAVLISQKEISAGSQSTVGTYSDAYDYLRIIYSVSGVRHCPQCGNEIIPLKEDKIVEIINGIDKVEICDLNRVPISGDTRKQRIEAALKVGKGAFFAKINGKYILFQTKQQCYRCNKIMFSLTPASFSYTNPESRCTVCNGSGTVLELDVDSLIERPDLSLLDGASSFWGNLRNFLKAPNANWMKGQVVGLADKMNINLESSWNDLPAEYKRALIEGSDEKVTFNYNNKKNGRSGEITRTVEGVRQIIKRLYDGSRRSDSILKYMKKQECSCCKGERLNKEGRSVSIGTIRYPDAASMTFIETEVFCKKLPELLGHDQFSRIKSYVERLSELSNAAIRLGLGYLELNRLTNTLSGGESQRLKLLTTMQNKMTGILYVLDEPSKGLHPDDYIKIADMLKQLTNSLNTVIMVEHNEDMISVADNIIEIGPGAGDKGGYLIGEGDLEAMASTNSTLYGQYLRNNRPDRISPKIDLSQFVELRGLNSNNLKNINIKFPKNALTCICGVSGSGKSTLMKQEIYTRMSQSDDFKEVILMDQKPVGRTPRSVIATYMDIMDIIRKYFATTREAINSNYDENYFSFNSDKGQCSMCKGEGILHLPYTEDDTVLCPECSGKRYRQEILNIKYHNKSISDVLNMSVAEACLFWKEDNDISRILSVISEVGLEYLKLGQSITTLSGGEASRIKLSKSLVKGRQKNTLFLFDEPTTGLHFSDIDRLSTLIRKIINQGNTVIAIEHNRQFLKEKDWLIQLGPGAGNLGGMVTKMDTI